jgi:hypothetical protein
MELLAEQDRLGHRETLLHGIYVRSSVPSIADEVIILEKLLVPLLDVAWNRVKVF